MDSRCYAGCLDNIAIDIIGMCDVEKFKIYQSNPNWQEISVPEVLIVPEEKPNIETIDKVFIKVIVTCTKLIETPAPKAGASGENAEGTKLTGRKLVVEGLLNQKIVYTSDTVCQTVHSAHFCVPFSTFIVLASGSMEEELCVRTCIEDVYVKVFNGREIFKNVTLLLTAEPKISC